MNYPRNFDRAPQNADPTMAAPAGYQAPAPPPPQAPYGGSGSDYSKYDQLSTDNYYSEQPPQYAQQPPQYAQQPSYGQQPPAPVFPQAQLPVYKRPSVVFGVAAVAAVIGIGCCGGHMDVERQRFHEAGQ